MAAFREQHVEHVVNVQWRFDLELLIDDKDENGDTTASFMNFYVTVGGQSVEMFSAFTGLPLDHLDIQVVNEESFAIIHGITSQFPTPPGDPDFLDILMEVDLDGNIAPVKFTVTVLNPAHPEGVAVRVYEITSNARHEIGSIRIQRSDRQLSFV